VPYKNYTYCEVNKQQYIHILAKHKTTYLDFINEPLGSALYPCRLLSLVDKQPNEAMHIDDSTPATSSHDWRTPFIKYLSDGSGFQDKTENERLIRRSKNYILVDGKLMRKNASSEVLLKCISQDDGIKLLDDIHAGSCGNHAASRTLVGKAFRAGFYWPTAVADAEKLVRHYEGCQFFAKRTHVPAHEIQTIPSS
jgi:hypothetical protein